MYIPDDVWDEHINEACDIVDSFRIIEQNYDELDKIPGLINLLTSSEGMLTAFINVQDQRVPEINGFINRVKFLLGIKIKSRTSRKVL